MNKKTPVKKEAEPVQAKRSRVSQEDVPAYSLSEALRVAKALFDNFGKTPASPLRVASAMDLSPTSSGFRMLTGASIAYGLTAGGYNAATIAIQPLASRILKPLNEGDDLNAKREAFLRPKLIKDFLERYDNSPFPKENIALNVLEDIGVPSDRCQKVHDIIVSGSKELGLLHEIKGKLYVDLQGITPIPISENNGERKETPSAVESLETPVQDELPTLLPIANSINKKVFITHGKNRAFVDPIKQLLQFGEMEAVVSVEKQSVSQPVPDKILSDMRLCSAAIIHVEDEMHLMDKDTKEHIMLNPNVLIEIGAAMALFKKRFILLVKDGVRLPSNLQGLFEVRYTGDNLDGDATIRLLKAINEMKKEPV